MKGLGNILADTDGMLDDEMLRDIKESVNLTYIEEQVEDGLKLQLFFDPLWKITNLSLLGDDIREYKDPQTFGLEQWCEFQEVGIIGDLVSSLDFVGDYSLLIVQQQRQ